MAASEEAEEEMSERNEPEDKSEEKSEDVAEPVDEDILTNIEAKPHLLNQQDFLTYRYAVRAIAVNPPAGDVSWPTLPQESWST